MTQNFTERPAIGTRVTLPEAIEVGMLWYRGNAGKSGVVYRHRNDRATVSVRFDDGDMDYGLWAALTPEFTTPAREITLNGHRYVLADTPAPEAEEKREPKQGEIWRDGPALYLITQKKDGLTAHLLGSGDIYAWDTAFGDDADDFTFAYPSLAAAIEAGEKFN